MSALLDHGPHTVTVYLEETVTDSYGNEIKRPSTTGVVIRGCILTPLSVERDATRLSSGPSDRDDYQWRFRARRAPLGTWSRVVWHDGCTERSMSVQSGPLQFGYSSATRHIAVTLQEEL